MHAKWIVLFGCLTSFSASPVGNAQEAAKSTTAAAKSPAQEKLKSIRASAIKYLQTQGQANDGTFSIQAGPGVTALVLTAMLRNGVPLEDPAIKKGIAAMQGVIKPDGGIYGNGRLKNYETCVGILFFAEANRLAKDGRYDKILADAKAFLISLQYGDGSVKTDSPDYGGVGYGGAGRPDMSNTAYFLEALHTLGTPETDPAVQRALVFISRCQNLASEHNTNPLSAKVNDGGFFYKLPAEADLESADRNAPAGGLRSYGSMTYSGLKSMIYAGLTKNDPRVEAAAKWIAMHYSLQENPGMGKAGLFYYYHTFGVALKTLGDPTITDGDGKSHAWRSELIEHLASIQKSDGSWQNDNQQWFESDKNLSTAFALLALAYCQE